jgi:hypothetical protein
MANEISRSARFGWARGTVRLAIANRFGPVTQQRLD